MSDLVYLCVCVFCVFLCVIFRSVGVCWFGLPLCQNFGFFRKLSKLSEPSIRKIQKLAETELVKVLLGRASFRTYPKAVLVLDYT